MQKPILIQKLEKELKTTFEQVDAEEIMEMEIEWNSKKSQYVINEKGEIIGLGINKFELKDLLKNVKKFKDLQFLNLDSTQFLCESTRTQISDISALSNLTNITYLKLRSAQISDISALSNLTNITYLNLGHNQISNISALSNLENLKVLDLKINQISDISALSNLTNITYLNLGHNQISNISALSNLTNITKLYLEANQISDISALRNLPNLTVLHLYNNQISDISTLNNLTNITHLTLGINKINNVSTLKNLTNIIHLRLNNNQISNISALKRLKKLKELDLRKNPIENLPEWICKFPNMDISWTDSWAINHITFYDNPLKEPPIEIVKQGNAAVKDYFENKRIAETEIKLILTGNSRAGKTTLLEFMKNPEVFTDKESTHGITVEHIKWKNFNLNVWDFGGQDYYHATHRLFLTNNAVYILVWEQNTNKTEKKNTTIFIGKEQKEEIVELQNYDYYHWLTVIRKYDDLERENSKDEKLKVHKSPVIMLQNKIDDTETGNNKIEKLNKTKQKKYSIGENNLFAISIKETHKNWKKTERYAEGYVNEYRNFENRLQELIKTELQNRQVLAYDVAIRTAVRERTENIISFSDYKKMCHKATKSVLGKPITEEQIRFATKGLHSQGVLIYYGYISNSAFLKDNVFIKPRYVTDTIYQILNKDVKENAGEFTLEDVIKVFQKSGQSKEAATYDAQLFINLMKSPNFELIFEDKYKTNTYYATQYLPEELKNEALKYFNKDKRTLPLAFVIRFDNYFSASIISRFIARYGFYADKKEKETTVFWKYGISFVRRDFSYLVYCKFEEKKIYVRTEKENLKNEIIFDLYNSIRTFSEDDNNISISLDDNNFDDLSTIQEQKNEKRDYWFCFGETVESVTIKTNNITIDGNGNIILQDVSRNQITINYNNTELFDDVINKYKEAEKAKHIDYSETVRILAFIKSTILTIKEQIQPIDQIKDLLHEVKKGQENGFRGIDKHLDEQDKILENLSLQISNLEEGFTKHLSDELKSEFEKIKAFIAKENEENGAAIAEKLMAEIDKAKGELGEYTKAYNELKKSKDWKAKIKLSIPLISYLGIDVGFESEVELNNMLKNFFKKTKTLFKDTKLKLPIAKI